MLSLQQCRSHPEELWRRLLNELLCRILLTPSISSRPIKFSQPSTEWMTFCLQPYPKQTAVMCSNIYDCQSDYGENPLNGRAKEPKRRKTKEITFCPRTLPTNIPNTFQSWKKKNKKKKEVGCTRSSLKQTRLKSRSRSGKWKSGSGEKWRVS